MNIRKRAAVLLTMTILSASISACSSIVIEENDVPIGAVETQTVNLNNRNVDIDITNLQKGEVTVCYLAAAQKRLKILITKDGGEAYQYDIHDSPADVITFTEGSGAYQLNVYENIVGKIYRAIYSATLYVEIEDAQQPFLVATPFVNFNEDSLCVQKAARLTADCKSDVELISVLMQYMINNFSYDYELSRTIQAGYVTDIDAAFEKMSGICLDYATVLTAMLRSLEIPTKLVFGYTHGTYHAWVEVYTEQDGWTIHDPTFLATSNMSQAAIAFVTEKGNYQARYYY